MEESLWKPRASLATLFSISEFTDCWINFVNPQVPFRPWKELEKNSRCIQSRLGRIKEVRSDIQLATNSALLLQAPPTVDAASRFRLHPLPQYCLPAILLAAGFLSLSWALESLLSTPRPPHPPL